jgi:hypothetical protein
MMGTVSTHTQTFCLPLIGPTGFAPDHVDQIRARDAANTRQPLQRIGPQREKRTRGSDGIGRR